MADRSSLLGSGLAKDRIVLGYVSWPFELSLFLLGVGLGLNMRWAGVVKIFDPPLIILKIRFQN